MTTAIILLALLGADPKIERLCDLVSDLDARLRMQARLIRVLDERLKALEARPPMCHCRPPCPPPLAPIPHPVPPDIEPEPEPIPAPIPEPEPKPPRIKIRNIADCTRHITVNGIRHTLRPGQEIILHPDAGIVRVNYLGRITSWQTSQWKGKTKVLHLR